MQLKAGPGVGANDYLAKPFAVGELWARIQVGLRMVELQEARVNELGQICALATTERVRRECLVAGKA